ncbi:MAG: hypothetical protein ACKO8I_01545 [Cyanobacteriota bacterium]
MYNWFRRCSCNACTGVTPQRLHGRDATDSIEAEIQTAKAGAERFGQIRHLNGIREMQREIVRGIAHHLLRIAAAGKCRAVGLILNITRRQGRAHSNGHKVETRDTDHVRSPGSNLKHQVSAAPLIRGDVAHIANCRDAM